MNDLSRLIEVKIMQPNYKLGVSLAVLSVLSACSATPKRIESLEAARTVVSQVEASPRAGIAASDISNARKSLDSADRLAAARGKMGDIEYEAKNALMSAQIANEKIATAQAREEIDSATAQRQAVLLQARDREVARNAQNADDARQLAADSALKQKSLEEELADLKAKRTERGLVLTLGDVLFDTGQAVLRTGAYGTLDRLASALKDKPARSVIIEGHTDNVGSDANNQLLSEHRASSVQSALLQRGVGTGQIQVVGKGEGVPIATNESEGGRQQNRRVELIFSEDPARVAGDVS
jgi:outer membrane protein OmpA-like peptidoglycan-associated protein